MRNRGVKLLAGLAGVVGAIRAVRRRPRGLSELSGQVALVTGGSRGLGLLLARELAARGCKVAICARDGAALERARRDLVARGATVHAEACDVADRAQIERLVANVRQALGPVDVLVNNAGILQVGPLETMALEDFQRAMATLFWSAVYAVHAVLPAMRARRHGRIVNITSIGGKLSIPHLVPYGCAKFALVGLSEGLRAELARDGILVTTVVPGLMRTGSPANVLYKGQADLEYSWFSLGAALPLSSMDAARAARRIVSAAANGKAYLTLGWQAKLARAFHALAPGLTADLLAVANRLLPASGGPGAFEALGKEMATGLSPSALTSMSDRAARELNQYGGATRPSAMHAEQAGLH